jgi:hypothetical protein
VNTALKWEIIEQLSDCPLQKRSSASWSCVAKFKCLILLTTITTVITKKHGGLTNNASASYLRRIDHFE